jgi:hypothetical protein
MDNIEIIKNNKIIMGEIIEKVRDGLVNELNAEQLVYTQILVRNGFMTEKGEITEEGKDALYQ